jgi:Flp pilus assembly protein TadG
MGAFVLFPILLFTIFITSVLGFFDYVHAEILVHAAAQTAATAAAQNITTLQTQGNYQGGGGQLVVDRTGAYAVMSQMLTNKPYITSWTCNPTKSAYNCTINYKVSMPILGDVSASTTVQGTYAANVATPNTSTPSSAPNLPIFQGSTTTLNPGWTKQSGTSYPSGSFASPPTDGGWDNGNASYKFTVASGQSTTITYGIHAGGYVNNGPASISVDGVLQAKITSGIGGGGQTTPTQQNLWSYTFGPGTYTVSMSGAINVYGLWSSTVSPRVPRS